MICINLFGFNLSSNIAKNATTVLVEFEKKNISSVKLTFDKQNIDFFKNPKKEDSYLALIPISYYQKAGDYKVIFSYIEDEKRNFSSRDLTIIDGAYKNEVLTVEPSKINLSKTNQDRVKKEYSEAIKVYKTVTNEILWSEDFIHPLNSEITSPFGTKRVYNGELKSYHGGTDFRAAVGTPIKASNSGIVKISSNRFYAGGSIVIDHGQGIYTTYFHLSSMNFKVGDFVNKGDIIGLSGSTGRVTGPHLHFGFRIYNQQVDPMDAIKLLNFIK